MSGDPNNSRITATIVGDAVVDGLSSRVFWGATNITYAFPDARADYDPTNYDPGSAFGESAGFIAFSTAQQNYAKSLMLTSYGNSANDGFSIEGFTNVSFSQGADTSANIRMANSSTDVSPLGWTYHAFPDQIQGGDFWISADNPGYASPQAGNEHAWIMTHELGHSMGLDHSWANTHETTNLWETMGRQYDDLEFTVMSYKSYQDANGASAGWGQADAASLPQTFMMGDIYTLQYMYGADYTTNSGNTTYSWDATTGDTYVNGVAGIDAVGAKIFATIWDGGGTDTYDLSAYTTDLMLNLNAGESSDFGKQRAELGNNRQATGNIYNALMFNNSTASLIENAIGGSGSDDITGNAVANTLTGNNGQDILRGWAGNDLLYGLIGADTLNGGAGNDTLYGGANADTFKFNTNGGVDVVKDYADGSDKIDIGAIWGNFATVQSHSTQSGANVVIALDTGNSVTIENWTLAAMNAGDFIF